jgi:cyclic pyranopterin phosphate synthase
MATAAPAPEETERRRALPLLPASHGVDRPNPRTVRISLTDRCDLACVYCRPSRADGYLEQGRRLDEDAWRAMVRALVAAGVRRVRLTGGEPLLHPNVVERVAFVASLASLGVEDLALTTNATRLAGLAAALRAAGLRRVTVSLDSLDPARFWRITRGGRLEGVLEGVAAAVAAGFEELKINTVVLRGDNDDELPAITEWAWARGIVPRFIEVMRVGEGARLSPDRVVSAAEMRERLAHLLGEGPWERDPGRGPARYITARRDPRLRVGFITGTTDTYCDSCDRLRLASDGVLRPCLATNDGVAAEALARAGDQDGLARAIREAWALKPDGRTWKGCTETSAADVSMRAIGG